MTIGGYHLFQIETGRFRLDGGAMFGVVPKPLWSKTNPPDDRNRIELASRALLAVGHGRVILVDNGNGSKFTEKQRDIYHLDLSRFDLLSSLHSAGYRASDITDVVLTHLHFDHAGGSTYKENGKLLPTFPHARYYVQKAQWEQALHPTEKDRASFFTDDFLPLEEYRLIEFIEGECDLFPHISLLVLNGHTAAQQVPKISDGTTTLLFSCDLFPTTAHIPLPYIMAYDLRPLVTLEEKKKILHDATENDWILFFEHDPRVAAGKVVRTDKGYIFGSVVDV
jgi:glyoxylase-like metal-dependent hydrolase (beta-lactamase superfamily II)